MNGMVYPIILENQTVLQLLKKVFQALLRITTTFIFLFVQIRRLELGQKHLTQFKSTYLFKALVNPLSTSQLMINLNFVISFYFYLYIFFLYFNQWGHPQCGALALLVVSFSTTFFFLIVVLAYFISLFSCNVVEGICNN